jgi:hypothetical protein
MIIGRSFGPLQTNFQQLIFRKSFQYSIVIIQVSDFLWHIFEPNIIQCVMCPMCHFSKKTTEQLNFNPSNLKDACHC